jgi:hypothetical protein
MKKTVTFAVVALLTLGVLFFAAGPAESLLGRDAEGGFWVTSLTQDCPRAQDPPGNDVCLDWTEKIGGMVVRLHSCCATAADVGKTNPSLCGNFRHDHAE